MGTCCCNTPDNGTPPVPAHPIVIPPANAGDPPLVIWGPPGPWPAPPIWLPTPPELPIPPEPPAGVQGPLPEDYAPPSNDGSNYFVAKPGTLLPTGPTGYLVCPLFPHVEHHE